MKSLEELILIGYETICCKVSMMNLFYPLEKDLVHLLLLKDWNWVGKTRIAFPEGSSLLEKVYEVMGSIDQDGQVRVFPTNDIENAKNVMDIGDTLNIYDENGKLVETFKK